MFEYDGEKYLTVTEMANELQVSDRTIRNWISNGYLLYVKIGGRYLIPERELKRILRALKN